jgi:CRP/FNR family cyclic AMP-dependent transcriptional regulator
MLGRFRGDDGERRLIDVLRGQQLVCDELALATDLAKVVSLSLIEPPAVLIEQGGADNDLFLILSGEFSIQVNGRELARRRTNQHVGELAVIDPRARRAATVIPTQSSVVARISETHFSALADRYPELWRRIAKELGDRLRERNAHVPPRHERPLMFVGSSREGLAVAQEVQSGLRYDPVSVVVWTDGVFGASRFPLESLEAQLAASDFAVLIATPDDVVASRGSTDSAPRDNIIFELGLFMGALTRHRTFILRQRGIDLKLPTDLLGLTPLDYNADGALPLVERLAPICHDLREIIQRLGPM